MKNKLVSLNNLTGHELFKGRVIILTGHMQLLTIWKSIGLFEVFCVNGYENDTNGEICNRY